MKKFTVAQQKHPIAHSFAPIGCNLLCVNGVELNPELTPNDIKTMIADNLPATLQFQLHSTTKELKKHLHVTFSNSFIKQTPYVYNSLDTTRMTLLFFAVGGLDLLQEFKNKDNICNFSDWVYGQQIHPNTTTNTTKYCGFRGGPHIGMPFHSDCEMCTPFHPWDRDHLAQSASALMVLDCADDDLKRINRKALLENIANHQLEDGSFMAILDHSEDDARYIYSACLICYLLDDWSPIDKDLTVQYLVHCQTYEGGFGFIQDREAHGGGTFCSVASLYMLNALDEINDRENLIRWCIFNQGEGFIGRTNKKADTCYSFWIGATLKILGCYDFTNKLGNYNFIMSCQNGLGGFSKHPHQYPDIMHTHFGLAGLALMGLNPEFTPFDTPECPYASCIITNRKK